MRAYEKPQYNREVRRCIPEGASLATSTKMPDAKKNTKKAAADYMMEPHDPQDSISSQALARNPPSRATKKLTEGTNSRLSTKNCQSKLVYTFGYILWLQIAEWQLAL